MRAGIPWPFTKERFMRDGKLNMVLLRPALEQFVRRWGYYDKETCCKVFEFVVELFKEDMNEGKKKSSRRSKSDSLPNEPEAGSANPVDEVEGGKVSLELL